MNSKVNLKTFFLETLLMAGLALLFMVPATASKTFQPVFNPTMEIEKAAGAIEIDGELDDPGWKSAVWSNSFVERNPGDNIEPTVETKVFVTYDNDYLYVGFICYDDPSDIRATMCQRDQFNGDDAVSVLIDTYGDTTWAYEVFVNPLWRSERLFMDKYYWRRPGV